MVDGHDEALADFKAKVEWSELINPIKDGGFLFVNMTPLRQSLLQAENISLGGQF